MRISIVKKREKKIFNFTRLKISIAYVEDKRK